VTDYLLDTNILSELRKPSPEAKVVAFVSAIALERLFVSTVTFAEIRFGIERLGEPARRADLDIRLARKLRPMFEGRVLPVSEDVMLTWRLMVEEGRKAGHTFSQPDLLIAATAHQHGLTLVSRDIREYKLARVAVLNPWED
jgi:hypothetical protein